MICYKIEKEEGSNRLQLCKRNKFTDVSIAYKLMDKSGAPVTDHDTFRSGKFLPHVHKKEVLELTENTTMSTIAINFLAKSRNMKILKVYTSIKVFTNKFCIDENQVSIIGALDIDILSKEIPIMTIFAEDLGYRGIGPDRCLRERYFKIRFYVRQRKKKYSDVELKDRRPSLYVNVTKMNDKSIIASEWYQEILKDIPDRQISKFKSFKGINDVYISNYQKVIVSDESEIDAALSRINNLQNKSRLITEGKLLVIPKPEDIKKYNLTDQAVVLLTDAYTRKDLIPYLRIKT
jgi:hypothetical protein